MEDWKSRFKPTAGHHWEPRWEPRGETPRWEPRWEPHFSPQPEPREEPRWAPQWEPQRGPSGGEAWGPSGGGWKPRWEPPQHYSGESNWHGGYWGPAELREQRPQPLNFDFIQPAWEGPGEGRWAGESPAPGPREALTRAERLAPAPPPGPWESTQLLEAGAEPSKLPGLWEAGQSPGAGLTAAEGTPGGFTQPAERRAGAAELPEGNAAGRVEKPPDAWAAGGAALSEGPEPRVGDAALGEAGAEAWRAPGGTHAHGPAQPHVESESRPYGRPPAETGESAGAGGTPKPSGGPPEFERAVALKPAVEAAGDWPRGEAEARSVEPAGPPPAVWQIREAQPAPSQQPPSAEGVTPAEPHSGREDGVIRAYLQPTVAPHAESPHPVAEAGEALRGQHRAEALPPAGPHAGDLPKASLEAPRPHGAVYKEPEALPAREAAPEIQRGEAARPEVQRDIIEAKAQRGVEATGEAGSPAGLHEAARLEYAKSALQPPAAGGLQEIRAVEAERGIPQEWRAEIPSPAGAGQLEAAGAHSAGAERLAEVLREGWGGAEPVAGAPAAGRVLPVLEGAVRPAELAGVEAPRLVEAEAPAYIEPARGAAGELRSEMARFREAVEAYLKGALDQDLLKAEMAKAWEAWDEALRKSPAAASGDPVLAVLAEAFRERVERARGDREAVAELAKLAELMRLWPPEAVAEAFRHGAEVLTAAEAAGLSAVEPSRAAERAEVEAGRGGAAGGLAGAGRPLQITPELREAAEGRLAGRRAVGRGAVRPPAAFRFEATPERVAAALGEAPAGAYVLAAMGRELAEAVGKRLAALREGVWSLLVDIAPYSPAKLPVGPPGIFHVPYKSQLAGYSDVAEFYKSPAGSRHLALAEALAHLAAHAALERLAYKLEGIAAYIISARAALELKRAAEAAARAGAHYAEVTKISAEEQYREAVRKAAGALPAAGRRAAAELAEELAKQIGGAARLLKAGRDLEKALEKVVEALRLERLYEIHGDKRLLEAAWARAVYKALTEGLRAPPISALDLPAGRPADPVEGAVASAARRWLAERVAALKAAARLSSPESAPPSLRHLARGLGDFKAEARRFVEEAKRAAAFSPAVKAELLSAAKRLAAASGVEKYAGVKLLQELGRVQPGGADFYSLPKRLRELSGLSEGDLIKAGYFDEALRAVYSSLRLPFKREDPRRVAEALAGRAAAVAKKLGVDPSPLLKALGELKEASVGEAPARAAGAGEALVKFAAEAVRALAERRGVNGGDALYALARAVARGLGAGRELAAEAVAELVKRGSPLAARSAKTAEALSGRLLAIPAEGYAEGRRTFIYILLHPSQLGQLKEVLDRVAAELAFKGYAAAPRPAEAALLLPEVELRRGLVYLRGNPFGELKRLAEALVRDAGRGEAAASVERLRRYALYLAKRYGLDYSPLEAGREEAAIGFAAVREAVGALKRRGRWGISLSIPLELMEGAALALGVERDEVIDVERALYWISSSELVPPFASKRAYAAAVRLYAEIAGVSEGEVWEHVYERLSNTLGPHYIRELEKFAREKLVEAWRLGAAGRKAGAPGGAVDNALGRAAGPPPASNAGATGGLIPPGEREVGAALWLARFFGGLEAANYTEVSRGLDGAAERVLEEVKARARGAWYWEAAAEAARRVVEVLATAARSRAALEYAYLALIGGRHDGDVLYGEYLRRAPEEARGLVLEAGIKFAQLARGIWERAERALGEVEEGLGRVGDLRDAISTVAQPMAAAIAYAEAGRFKEAVEAAREAARRIYEAAREAFEKAKITLERIYEIIVEAVARVLDYIKAHWFILAATAAGLIGWLAAQQLDYTLWQDHLAKFAPLIAGVPAFKEFKTALSDSDPVLKAAEEALKHMSGDAVKRLFEEARRAVGKSSKPWSDLRKVARDVERYGKEGVRPEHAAVAWVLLEAGLRELGDVRDKALSALREAEEKLSRGEEVEMSTKELSEFVRRARDVAHRLELLFEDLVKNVEKHSEKEMRKALAVTELAGELAEASKADFGELGGATLADKVVAFFESLAEGTAWSRVVINAAERGEAYGALIRTPRGALDKYGAGREKAKGEEGRLGAVISRLAYWLAERGVDKAVVRREGDKVEVVVDDETVAEVRIRAIKMEDERESVIFNAWGKWVEEEGKKAAELAAKIEPSKAKKHQIYALLATDGSYEAEGEVNASTTSVLQAALYRRFGMEVSRTEGGNLTEDGLKPQLAAKFYKESGGEKVVEMIRRDLEEGLRTLLGNAKLREELREKALKLLSEMKISVQGADVTDEGRQRVEEARRKIEERIKRFLTDLRLGENGSVCLVNCQFGETALTYKHEPYARVIAPLVHYIASGAPEEEVMRFLAYAVLFDGHVRTGEISLTLGNFRVASRRLPLDVYDKIALYIILAAKYGVGVNGVYVRGREIRLYFDAEYATGVFATAWTELSRLWRFGMEHGLYADHIFNKLDNIRRYVEEYANKLRIEYELYSPQGVDPWVEVRFKDDRGNEIAHINIRWEGESLRAEFTGAKEKAERLASILNALGASVEAKELGGEWRVQLTTGHITAIRRVEWLEAVKALVEELHRRGMVNERQRDRLLTEINAGPNVVEIANVELSVRAPTTNKFKRLEIVYQPRSAKAFDAAVNALRDAGFVEGVHFTAKKPEGGKLGHVYIKLPAGLWRLVELRRQGVDWADKALRRLEEIAKARGFYDLLEEYLRPAMEAETVDPRGLVAEDVERGMRAVVKDVKATWEGGKPRVVVEYEVGGDAKSFFFTWRVKTGGGVIAGVKLNDEKALVLAALLGDGAIREKRGSITLTARHLLALAKYKGAGWELLRWYAEVMKESAEL